MLPKVNVNYQVSSGVQSLAPQLPPSSQLVAQQLMHPDLQEMMNNMMEAVNAATNAADAAVASVATSVATIAATTAVAKATRSMSAMRKPAYEYECEVAAKVVESFRPEIKYSGEDRSVDFLDFMFDFENVVNREGFSAQLKLLELSHWFEGLAFLPIENLLFRRDCEAVFNEAINILKKQNCLNKVSVDDKLALIMKGGKLSHTDSVGVHTFIAKLTQTFKQAVRTGREEEFNRKRLIQSVLQFKLPEWMKLDWVKEVVDHAKLEDVSYEWSFKNFIEFLNSQSAMTEAWADCSTESLEMDSGNESEEATDGNLREPML